MIVIWHVPNVVFLAILYAMSSVVESRALYMGELRKNTTSTGTITKKNPVTLASLRLLVQKKKNYEVNFFYSLIKLNFSLILRLIEAKK